MKDRFVAGIIAGLVGGIFQTGYSFLLRPFTKTDRTFIEFGKVFLMYKDYKGIIAEIIGITVLLSLDGLLGVLFVLMFERFSRRYYYVKALAFGSFTWLALGVAGTVFRLPLFMGIPPGHAVGILLGALMYGLVAAFTLAAINPEIGLESRS